MVYDRTPLTAQFLGAIAQNWGCHVPCGERLHGGEESSAYRLGDRVVRIGPSWRSDEELEWAYGIATFAARTLPEAIAPIANAAGATVFRVESRPVSLWPFRVGAWPDRRKAYQVQAAQLLARLHCVLARFVVVPRPSPNAAFATASELIDPRLDHWLDEFESIFRGRQPLHGDFYPGNTLAEDGRLIGLLDWDDAFIGPPERELAWAAWEWGDGLRTMDLLQSLRFIDAYVDAGGVAQRIDERTLRQLVRERIRREVRYARAARARGVPHDAGDYGYELRQLNAFEALRP